MTKNKFNAISLDSCFSELLKLVSSGLTLSEAALRWGYSVNSIYNYFSKNPDRREVYEKVKARATRELIEGSLRRLGVGYDTTERIEEFIEEKNGRVVKVKEKVTRMAPSLKALEALGNKYCPGEFKHVERSESEVKVKITAEHKALSFEEKLGILMRERNGGQILKLSSEDYEVTDSGRVELSEAIEEKLST